MAATGKTPILLYGSTTATNTPVAGNLTNSSDGCEIAINVADKNLFFKDATNAVNTVPIRQSSGSSDGWLSSANWTTFNSKQAAYTNLTSIGSLANATGWLYNNGSGTFSYSTPSKSDVGLGNVTNDAQTKAAIVPNTAPSAGQILVGNAGGTAYAPVSMSGDATLASTGAATLATVNSNVGSYTNASVTVNAKGLVTAVSSGTAPVTSVTGTAPVVSSGGTTPAISMAAATGSVNGYLTSTDWTTFNNKAPGVTFTTNYVPYGQGTTTLNQSASLTFNGTSLNSGGGTLQYAPRLGARVSGNDVEWGHGNSAGYGNTLGAEAGSGAAFIAFYSGAGTNSNTYKTLGRVGSVIKPDASGGFGFYSVANSSADNQSLTTVATLSTAGNLAINGNLVISTSGKGIDFSATSDGSGTATSELLADYEEGTFTPTLTGGTTNPTVTYTLQRGEYVKVGNLVYVSVYLSWSALSGGSGEARFTLPYTVSGSPGAYCSGAISQATGITYNASRTYIAMQGVAGGAYGRIMQNGSNVSAPVTVISDLSTGAGVFVYTVVFKV